jgi:Branched-chain amino acid transport protein (AzlD)
MEGWIQALETASGGLWPYLVIIIFGFLPTEFWRVAGVLAGRSINENSEVFVFVRMVAAGLVAAVVAKLVLSPAGALAVVPFAARIGAVGIGVVAMLLTRRSILAGLVAGEVTLILAGWWLTQ